MITLIDVNLFNNIPQGALIHSIAANLQIPCDTLFVAAIVKNIKKSLPDYDRAEIAKLAQSACSTQNPDIIWQIFKVETNFRVHIVNLGGEKVLVGRAAKDYVENGLKKSDNVDIGPLQINWRANGSRFLYDPAQYFDGSFSVLFVSTYLLKDLVTSCKLEWINCYHSYNKLRGKNYREKIDRAENDLKQVLFDLIKL